MFNLMNDVKVVLHLRSLKKSKILQDFWDLPRYFKIYQDLIRSASVWIAYLFVQFVTFKHTLVLKGHLPDLSRTQHSVGKKASTWLKLNQIKQQNWLTMFNVIVVFYSRSMLHRYTLRLSSSLSDPDVLVIVWSEMAACDKIKISTKRKSGNISTC